MTVNVNEALYINIFYEPLKTQQSACVLLILFPDPHTHTQQEVKVFTLKGLVVESFFGY